MRHHLTIDAIVYINQNKKLNWINISSDTIKIKK